MSVRAGRLVPRASQGRCGGSARRQLGQRQCLHRQVRPRGDRAHRQARRGSRRMQAVERLPGVDRRDRRAARCQQVRRRDWRAHCKRRARQVARGRQGHHDHRYLSEGRRRHRAARRDAGHDLRHRQRRRHDRPRHGDPACLRVHRCADLGAHPAEPAQGRRRRHLQRGHDRQRHLDLGHAVGVCHRCRGRARRSKDHAGVRPAARRLPQGVRRRARQSAEQVARDGEAARKLVEVVVEGAVSKPLPARSRSRSPTRRW